MRLSHLGRSCLTISYAVVPPTFAISEAEMWSGELFLVDGLAPLEAQPANARTIRDIGKMRRTEGSFEKESVSYHMSNNEKKSTNHPA